MELRESALEDRADLLCRALSRAAPRAASRILFRVSRPFAPAPIRTPPSIDVRILVLETRVVRLHPQESPRLVDVSVRPALVRRTLPRDKVSDRTSLRRVPPRLPATEEALARPKVLTIPRTLPLPLWVLRWTVRCRRVRPRVGDGINERISVSLRERKSVISPSWLG